MDDYSVKYTESEYVQYAMPSHYWAKFSATKGFYFHRYHSKGFDFDRYCSKSEVLQVCNAFCNKRLLFTYIILEI
jgi:hypothetical protein